MHERASKTDDGTDHSPAIAENVEHRQFARLSVRQEAELVGVGCGRVDRRPLQVYIQDVGLGGIGFVCSEALEPNSLWRISVVQRGYILSEQTIIVRHCQAEGTDRFIVGGQCCLSASFLHTLGVDPESAMDVEVNQAIRSAYGYMPSAEL